MENLDRKRRKLIGGALVTGAALLLSAKGGVDCREAAASSSFAMIIDVQRCMNCKACMVACKTVQKTPYALFNTRIKVLSRDGMKGFMPLLCNHCDDPPCGKACPADAIFKLDSGIVVTDWNSCDGQGDCVSACPFGMRHIDSEYAGRSFKCDFCLERLERGLLPKCVEICPAGARLFGDLSNPRGEFAEYLSRKGLVSLGDKKGIRTRVLYAGIDG